MTPLRKKILTLARKFDGAIMTMAQAYDLSGTLGSMDDTLTDEEVFMFLTMFAEGREPDLVIGFVPSSPRLVKVNIDEKGEMTISAAPFSNS